MKALTTAIYGKLSGSALGTDIGGRLYKGRAPEGAEYPYVVFMLVSDVPDLTFSEKYQDVLIQFSLFSSASGSTEIEDMFTHLKTLYDECSLSPTNETLIYMMRGNTTLMIEGHTTPAGTADVWHYAVDYNLMVKV